MMLDDGPKIAIQAVGLVSFLFATVFLCSWIGLGRGGTMIVGGMAFVLLMYAVELFAKRADN